MFAIIFCVFSICVLQSVAANGFGNGADKDMSTLQGQCILSNCDKFCREIGYNKGTCDGDYCICQFSYHATGGVSTCDPAECNTVCRSLGFDSGTCQGNSCYCQKNYIKYSTVKHVQSCEYYACYDSCRSRGFDGGWCWLDNCKCVNFTYSIAKEVLSPDTPSITRLRIINAWKNTHVPETTRAPANSDLGNDIMDNSIDDNTINGIDVDEPHTKNTNEQEGSITCNAVDCILNCAGNNKSGLCWRGKCKCY